MKLSAIAACVAWGAVAVSSSVGTANAVACTQQTGSWANCSAAYDQNFRVMCDTSLNYIQVIKLAGSTCTGGDCERQIPFVYTDLVYPSGRYLVIDTSHCDNWNLFQLGDCAC